MSALRSQIKSWLLKVVSPFALIFAIGFAIHEIPFLSEGLIWVFKNMGEGGQALIFLCGILLLLYFVMRYLERENRVSTLEAEKAAIEEERDHLQNTMDCLAERVNEDIWKRPATGVVPFRPKEERKARFVAFFNLKGGPGKTTLAANISACIASPANSPKVLVIDLDFQGTLSNICVENSLRELQRQHGHTSARLLDSDPEMLGRLVTDMNRIPNAKVILSEDNLEQADFTAQAKFFLKPEENDVRFHYRRLLQHGTVADEFDLVIFDCPPRLTTSSVNALTCSDYVVIPTKLDEKSIDAVVRTLRLVQRLSHIAHPTILGIAANEVAYYRGKTLIKAHSNGLRDLKDRVATFDPYIFGSKVKLDRRIAVQKVAGLVPAVDPKVKAQFFALAQEMRRRIT